MIRPVVLMALLLATPVLASEPVGLTPDQLSGLRAGRGMNLSLPAERNHHPGPLHVVENAEALGLDPSQRQAAEGLVAAMRADAVALGEQVIAAEGELAALFAAGRPDEPGLAEVVGGIARLNGALRLVHLRAHVATTDLLSPQQIAAYDRIRHHLHRPTE